MNLRMSGVINKSKKEWIGKWFNKKYYISVNPKI